METSRTPPPSGPPPSYAFVTRVYKRSLRPVVIFIGFLVALWSLFTSIGFFKAANVDKEQNHQDLFSISIALGVLYITICLASVFGVLAASLRHLVMIRIYAYLSMLSALIAASAGLTRVVIHYVKKNTLIDECTKAATGGRVVFRFGWFGPTSEDVLDSSEAKQWCQRAWDRDSVSEIIELLIVIFLAISFVSVSLAYYRQALDPSSVANASRAPSYQARLAMYPTYYNPPYNGPAPPYGAHVPYGGAPPPFQQYAPPAGPPPGVPGYNLPKEQAHMAHSNDSKDRNPFDDYDEDRQREALSNTNASRHS